MPSWFSDRWDVLRDALTLRRVLAVSIVFAIATAVAAFSQRIAQWLSGGVASSLFGVPPWTWGVLVSLFLVSWFLMEYALHLKRESTPRLRASFDPRKAGITWAIERPVVQNALAPDAGFRATYIRFRVEALTKKAVRDCTAHLINIWKLQPPDGQPIEVDLPHVIGLGPPQFDVLPYAHRMIDFLRCNETDNILRPTAPWPFHLEHVFDEPATYRFQFAVEGDGVSETLTVDVHWTGVWNTIKAEQASPGT